MPTRSASTASARSPRPGRIDLRLRVRVPHETELANDFGTPRQPDPAMIERYATASSRSVPDRRWRGDEGSGRPDERVSELLDRAEVSRVLRPAGGGAAPQPLRRERQPWVSGQDAADPGRAALAPSSTTSREGLRVVTLLLAAYIPDSADRLLAALGIEGLPSPIRRARRGPSAERIPPCSPSSTVSVDPALSIRGLRRDPARRRRWAALTSRSGGEARRPLGPKRSRQDDVDEDRLRADSPDSRDG